MKKLILLLLIASPSIILSDPTISIYKSWYYASNSKTPPTEEGLISYWDMEEAGGVIADQVGTNTMTVVNQVVFDNSYGIRGKGADFDGTNDYLTAASFTTGVFTNQMTISAWINVDRVLDYYTLIGRWNDGGGKRTFIVSERRNDIGGMVFNTSANGTDGQGMYATTNGLYLNTWRHVATTFNAGAINIYYNGRLVGSTNNTTQFSFYQAGSDPINIGGKCNVAGAERWYDGSIDEVRMYNRALSVDEIEVLYNWDKP